MISRSPQSAAKCNAELPCRSWLRNRNETTWRWFWTKDLLVEWTERAVARLLNVFPDDLDRNKSIWRGHVVHARYVLESDLIEKCGANRINLVWKVGFRLWIDKGFNEAEILLTDVVEATKRLHGTEHPCTLISMDRLALTFIYEGRWKEAEEQKVQVIETNKRVLGAEHPDTLTSRASLARTPRDQGRWKEVEKLYMQVTETSKRALGMEYLPTIVHTNILVMMWVRQGHYKKAGELTAQVMETEAGTWC
jgi:hypothetical protein